MATFLRLCHLFGGQLFQLFARETNLKKQSSVQWNYLEVAQKKIPTQVFPQLQCTTL